VQDLDRIQFVAYGIMFFIDPLKYNWLKPRLMQNYDLFNPSLYGTHIKALGLVGKNKKVLELGCATGQISRRLAENGCDVVGIEIDEESARVAEKYCKAIYVGDIETVGDMPYHGYFDCLLMLDVLEHLRHPSDVLKSLKKYLKEDGYIIASIPNVANWQVRWDLMLGRFEYKDSGILDRTHLRFFNEKSAKELFHGAGFNITGFDIVPALPAIPMRSSRIYSIAKLWPNLFAMQFLIIGTADKDMPLV